MKSILQMLGWTGQRAPLPGAAMVANDAGGYVYALDDWARLDRFLVLGTEGGTYYASEAKLTRENTQVVARCIAADGARAVARIVEMSVAGRAPKQDPILFALALATAADDVMTRAAALAAIPRVARTGAQLQRLVGYIDGLRGWAAACGGRWRGGTSISRWRISSCRP